MYDDVLSATVLIGVSAVIAAVFVSAAVEPPAATVGAKPAPQPVEAMAVFELPRVVVKGSRSRDGDLMATSAAKPPLELANPNRKPAR